MVAVERMISVLLLDVQTLVVEAIAACLAEAPGVVVAEATSSCERATEILVERQPDIFVLDVDVPGRGAFDLIGSVSRYSSRTKVIILTSYLSDAFLEQALRIGASFILKSETISSLIGAIHKVANGETVFSTAALERLRLDPKLGQYVLERECALSELTGRQLEVLRHLAYGQSVKEIAKEMHLSQKSIDSHKYRIMNKLGIHDRVELARFAIREGLLLP